MSEPSPPGWYVDPTSNGKQRFWDGAGWTERFADAELPPPSPQPQLGPTNHAPNPVASKGSRPWWRRKRFIIPAALVALAAVGSALQEPKPVSVAGTSATVLRGSSEPSSSQAAATAAVTTTQAKTASTESVATAAKVTPNVVATTTPKATTSVIPRTTVPGFGSGTLRVNDQIVPGRYSAAATPGCYYARLSGTSGQLTDILSNNNANGHVIVDILPTDAAFQSTRCGRFSVYSPPFLPFAIITEGDWIVGEEIVPGVYETAGTKACYWARSRDATGDVRAIIANDNADGPVTVTVTGGEIFRSSRCGIWTKVG